MRQTTKVLLSVIVLIAALLSACSVDNSVLICLNNPQNATSPDTVCRQNDGKGIKAEVEHFEPVLTVGSQEKAIYYGYWEDQKSTIYSAPGAYQVPNSKSLHLPTMVQDFRTDANPDAEFCATQKPRCIAPMGDVTLQYTSAAGQVRTISGLTINLQGSLALVVDDNTKGMWLTLDLSNPSQDFWYAFWDKVRVPKTIDLTASGIDPIADQWGAATNAAVAQSLTERLKGWDYAPLVSLIDGTINVKSIDVPTKPGDVSGGQIDALATQNAVDRTQAEAFATQQAIICQNVENDLACAMLMETFKGGDQTPVPIVPINP